MEDYKLVFFQRCHVSLLGFVLYFPLFAWCQSTPTSLSATSLLKESAQPLVMAQSKVLDAPFSEAGLLEAGLLEPRLLEEIVVSSRRHQESVLRIPLAVSVISAEDISSRYLRDLMDIQSLVPNLSLHMGDAANAIAYIRGVGQNDSLSSSDPGIGIYLDNVYLGRTQGALLDILETDRVEVLRGPQGTLYGRNTIGGAIKYHSKSPTDELSANAEISLGNYDYRHIKTSVSGRIWPQGWLAKLSLAKIMRSGYAMNEIANEDDGDRDDDVWRFQLQARPEADWQWQASIDGTRKDPDHALTPARLTEVFGVPASRDPALIRANFNQADGMATQGYSISVQKDIAPQTAISSISSYRSLSNKSNLDLDATELSVFGIFIDHDQYQVSQEFQVFYQAESWNYVTGLYYLKEVDKMISGVFGPDIELMTSSINSQRMSSYALFSHVTVDLTERWQLSLGGRYSREKKRFDRVQELFAAQSNFPLVMGRGIAVITKVEDENQWSSFLPSLSMSFKLSQQQSLFSRISKGFKSGGFDGRSNDAFEANPYDPETLWAYEAGWKYRGNQRGGQTSEQLFVTAFYNDYQNLQLSSFSANPESGNFEALFTNAGRAVTQGVEVEALLVWQQTKLNASVGFLDAQYKEYIGESGGNIADQRSMVHAPEWTLGIAPSVQVPITSTGGSVAIMADYHYRTKTYTTVSSSELLAQDSYGLLSASITYVSADERWKLALQGKNLTDEQYLIHGFDLSQSFGYQLGYYGEPRTYSLVSRYDF